MTRHDIVKKLIGPINPVGDSAIDKERLARQAERTLEDIRSNLGWKK